ncbi:ABC transporter permease [Herpetosiphon llansteffanensis]|uniref:ABC transporter permease n=1 Tax=Herpetosiphon llansteffanensis TaxID=2094568 RepID=UPI000D7BACFC|nr:iron ABC transporter permease [Herpetosiphon llansteffanensis]
MVFKRLQLTRPRRWPALMLTISAGLIALMMVLPLGYLLLRTSEAGDAAWAQLQRPTTLRVFTGSALLAITVTLGSLLIGLPLAWLTTRTNLPGARIWLGLIMLPMAIPSYIGAWAIIAVLGPRGLLQQWLAPLGVERLPEVYGFWGAAGALILFGYPYIVLNVRVALRKLDPALEEAARSLGQRSGQIFWRITLPQLRPALAAGSLLVVLYALSDFGAVSLLRYSSFTRAIYLQYRASFDRTGAAVLSLLLVGLACGLLAAEALSRGRARYYRSSAGVSRQAKVVELGRWRWPALLFCSVVVLFAVVLPIVAIVAWLIIGIRSGQAWNVQLADLGNSLLAASLAALVTIVLAFPVVFLAVRYPSRLTSLIERATYVGYALPGIVVALALVFWGANYVPWAYQTLGLLILAYAVRFLPQAIGSLRTSLLQINPRLEEAGRSLGQPPWRVVLSITLPLLRPGIVSGAALVFLSTLKELPATLLLGPTGFHTLATDIWNNTTELRFSQTALPALLLMLAACGSLALLLANERKT